MQRHDLLPLDIEMVGGKLLLSEQDRLTLLAALLENVGAAKAVQLGDPQVWRAAVDRLAKPPRELETLLLEGLRGDETLLTGEDWEALREEALARIKARKASR